jgi:hypothetical protein
MAIPEDDRVIRRTGGFRDQSNSSMVAIAVAALIIGLIMLFMMVRADAPTSVTTNPTKAPVTSTSPTPATPRP